MSVKKFNKVDLDEIHGPMNSVSKEDAEVWAAKKARSKDFSQEQLHRIEVAKKKKAVRSTTKQDRRTSKNILKNIGDD